MAKKATLVCRPCGTRVVVTDLGAAVVECYECGVELEPHAATKPAARKALKKAPAAAKKPAKGVKKAAKKAAPKRKK